MGQYGELHFLNILRLSNRYIVLVPVLALILLVAGCDENFNEFNGDPASGDSSNIENDNTAPVFTSQPIFTLAPNPDTPLAGLLELGTDEPTSVSVTITEAATTTTTLNRAAFESSTIEFNDRAIEHSLPILGFTPDGSFMLQITVSDAFGNQTQFDQPILVDTDPLPEGFPPIEVSSSDTQLIEPGVTLIPLRGFGANAVLGTFVTILNAEGDVVWYHKPEDPLAIGDLRRISNGNLVFIHNDMNIKEIDMLGNVVRQWHALNNPAPAPDSIFLDSRALHHEIFEKEDGNFLVLGLEARLIDNFPTSDSDPFAPTETAAVVGDEVIEFSPDGTILNKWLLLDMLDPLRIAYSALLGLWNSFFPEFENGTRDWSHGNAVIHDSSDNSIIVSLRHQDAIVKFDAETGELIWILGPHENWDQELFGEFLLNPVGDNFIWQYHQHAPFITPEGTLLVFDNGNFKASPFDQILPATENFSRAVEYLIDEDTMEVMQVWEYGEFADEIIYTPFIGDADYMPETGNILITFGGRTLDAEGNPTDAVGGSETSARIIEVTHTIPAEKVLDITISDQVPEPGKGWIVYRSERLPSLYPEQ